MKYILPHLTSLCALFLLSPLAAQTRAYPLPTPSVATSSDRVEQENSSPSGSVDSLSSQVLRNAQWQVNSSETLNRIPGINVQNRQSYSQDQQISIRGYGARSGFGIRGIRIVVDDIPASMPDGQGQMGTVDFSSADRIDVLRGPLALLYGNHSGGLIQVVTEPGSKQPYLEGNYTQGSFRTSRWGVKLTGQDTQTNSDYVFSGSRFNTDGYRDHSKAQKTLANVKLTIGLQGNDPVTIVASYLDQPNSQDPLGLTKEQWQDNPRQAIDSATQFDTRRDLKNRQGGLAWTHLFNNAEKMKLTLYYGERKSTQYLSTPLAVQNIATSSGGVASINNNFWGSGFSISHQSQDYVLISGIEYETLTDGRKGYINDNGTQGALKRDEDNLAKSLSVYLRGELPLDAKWSLVGGVRYSSVRFTVNDHYITANNGDDSGKVTFNGVMPVGGVIFRATPTLNFYANIGRGFETPTFAELAYRTDGSGPNLSLKPANSVSAEAGLNAFLKEKTRINLAVFSAHTKNDLIAVQSSDGRTTYGNSKTKRNGAEISIVADPHQSFNLFIAGTWMKGTFDENNRKLPGTPVFSYYTAATWKDEPSGLSTTIDWRGTGKIYVDDSNTAAASPAYNLLGASISLAQKQEGWSARQFLRMDNIMNKKYISGVVLNDANGRYYYPGSGRNWLLGIVVGYSFL